MYSSQVRNDLWVQETLCISLQNMIFQEASLAGKHHIYNIFGYINECYILYFGTMMNTMYSHI